MVDFLQSLPANFTFGVLVGLVVGIASRAAIWILVYVAGAVIALELVRMAFAS